MVRVSAGGGSLPPPRPGGTSRFVACPLILRRAEPLEDRRGGHAGESGLHDRGVSHDLSGRSVRDVSGRSCDLVEGVGGGDEVGGLFECAEIGAAQLAVSLVDHL